MNTRTKRGDPLVRAALRLHRALSAGAESRGECGMDATRVAGRVMEAVPSLEQCRRRLALARGRGWSLAACRLEEQLWWHLRALGHQLQSAASGPPPVPRPNVPPVSTLIDELRQLEQEFGSVELHYDEERGGMVVAAKTDPITLEGVYLGDFSLRLGVDRLAAGRTDSACFRVVALDPHPAPCSEGTTHPHVRDESLCAGDAAEAIEAALREGRVCDAFLLVRSVLGTYNASSPYVSLEQWSGGECGDCGGGFGQDELYGCGHCGGEFCGECSGACDVCGDACCLGCRREAADQWLCPDCAGACRRCGYTTRQVELDEGDGLCGDCLEKQEQLDEEPPAEAALVAEEGGDGTVCGDAEGGDDLHPTTQES